MATPTVIASASATYFTTSATSASSGVTTTNATKLLAFVVGESNSGHGVTDSNGNSWAQVGTTYTASSYPSYVSVWQTSSATPTVGTGHTFTGTATNGYPTILVAALGPSAGGALTVGTPVSNTDATSPFESPGLTTDAALLIGAYFPTLAATVSATHGNSFSSVVAVNSSSYWQGVLSQRTVTASGTYNTSVTDAGGTPSAVLNWLAAVTEAGTAGSHTASGALAGGGAAIAGTATHRTRHSATGSLAGGGAAIAATAIHKVRHSVAGALTGGGSAVAGTAVHTGEVVYTASGALVGQGSVIVGAAARRALHTAVGSLTGPGAAVAGVAEYIADSVHTATGALVGAGSTVAGTAVRRARHSASGVLVGQGAALAGTARRWRAHATSGALVGQGAAVVGAASHLIRHSASGTLVGAGASLSGVVERSITSTEHAASGVLRGQGSTLVGTATHRSLHTVGGTLAGAGAILVGAATHTGKHSASGILIGQGAELVGAASHVGTATEAPTYSGGWEDQRRSRKDRDDERRRLGMLPPEVPTESRADALTADEVREVTQSDREAAKRAASRILAQRAPKAPDASATALPLDEPMEQFDPQQELAVVELILAAQRRQMFEQDLVYIVAVVLST